jgi:toxin secretion/phage lysis holin
MSRAKQLTEMLCFSGIMGIISEVLGNIKISYIILLVLLTIDTTTGMAAAIKYNRFSSKGLLKLVKKIITYSLCILTVRLLEIGILSLIETTMLSQITVAFLIAAETVSILENLTMLGVPLPSNFIIYLISYLKIPGINSHLSIYRNTEKDILEIEDIIKNQIPLFHNETIRKLLEIKFAIWKEVTLRINDLLRDTDSNNNELVFYKIMAIIEFGFNEETEQWKEKEIPLEYVEQFNITHQPKFEKWLLKVKHICYSAESIQNKKEQLVDSIITLLYQTIIDAIKKYN